MEEIEISASLSQVVEVILTVPNPFTIPVLEQILQTVTKKQTRKTSLPSLPPFTIVNHDLGGREGSGNSSIACFPSVPPHCKHCARPVLAILSSCLLPQK